MRLMAVVLKCYVGKNNCKHNINKSKINKLLSDEKKITSTSYKNFSKE